MRLIDADELKKHIRRCDDSATRVTFDFVDEDDIDDATTVDVLEQIRDEITRFDANGKSDPYRTGVSDMQDYVLEVISKYE